MGVRIISTSILAPLYTPVQLITSALKIKIFIKNTFIPNYTIFTLKLNFIKY